MRARKGCWKKVRVSYEFNVLGTVRVIRAALDCLKKSQTGGRIVILGAVGARMPYPNQVVSNVHKSSYVTCQSILVDGGIARGLV